MVTHVSLGTIISLIDAIERRRVVRVAYTHRETDGSLAPNLDDAGAEKSYLLEPYQLAFKNGHYYLICRPHDGALADGHPWYLRVDHIADVRATRRGFDAPPSNVELGGDHFDAVSHMDEMAYPLGGRVEHVRVRTTLLDAIYDWYPTASVRRVDMGDAQEPVYEAEFDTVLLPTCWWALQYAEYVEVLGPQALRDMIAQSVRTLERTYDIEPEARSNEAQRSKAGQNDPRHSDPQQSDQKR
nr:WYL domain-containing protein [Olsenella intestinalis]